MKAPDGLTVELILANLRRAGSCQVLLDGDFADVGAAELRAVVRRRAAAEQMRLRTRQRVLPVGVDGACGTCGAAGRGFTGGTVRVDMTVPGHVPSFPWVIDGVPVPTTLPTLVDRTGSDALDVSRRFGS